MTSINAPESIIGGKDNLRYGVPMILQREKLAKRKGGMLISKT